MKPTDRCYLDLVLKRLFSVSHFPHRHSFSCRTSKHVHSQNISLFSKWTLLVTDPVYHQKDLNSRCHKSSKLKHKNTSNEYFAAQTGSFNQCGRPISKYELQYQSFNSVWIFLLRRHPPHDHSISCPAYHLELTNNNLFTGIIGLIHVTRSLVLSIRVGQ